jgi:hypothetical protein
MPELIGRGPVVYAMTAAGLALIYGLPRLTRERETNRIRLPSRRNPAAIWISPVRIVAANR